MYWSTRKLDEFSHMSSFIEIRLSQKAVGPKPSQIFSNLGDTPTNRRYAQAIQELVR